jgi:hypothetical protein
MSCIEIIVSDHMVCRTFYSWVPLWGPICALLYLSRNGYTKQRASNNSVVQPLIPNATINDDYSSQHTNNPLIRNHSDSTTEEDSRATSKVLSEDHMLGLMSTHEGYSSGNPDSGSIFFSDELITDLHVEGALSYMHGQSQYTASDRVTNYSSGYREFIVNTPQDSDERFPRSIDRT